MADLMRKAESVVRAEGGTRATRLVVHLGALSHLSPSHLRGHFAEAARGTRLDGADLHIEVGTDPEDPNAQSVLLVSVDVETDATLG